MTSSSPQPDEAPSTAPASPAAPAHARGEYVVVARRYRPQAFEELIGQQHVARALANAITAGRVGHAYLFSGARGVGKTSAARILAKALNCERGTSTTPCNACDICQSVSSGEDVDVLEIDGASNRGIDEIRELRQNVGVRPARARFKIYIIDEVHMLTREAFNALLKTLEEPPEHVKFIFCTTEAERIPVTILSRCQRFDFAGIQHAEIVERLRQIVAAEQAEADDAALELIARRAAGSMRDSQSLLEQLLSFCGDHVRPEDVNAILGTADTGRVVEMLGLLASSDVSAALTELDAAAAEGVDLGQLTVQLLGVLRDGMLLAVGGDAKGLLHTGNDDVGRLSEIVEQLGLDNVLAAMQLLDHTLARMRYSTHGRTLVELALVQISRLEDLASVAGLVEQIASGSAAAPPSSTAQVARRSPQVAKKKYDSPAEPTNGASPMAPASAEPAHDTATAPQLELTDHTAAGVWHTAVANLSGMVADHARTAANVRLDGNDRLVAEFPTMLHKEFCERPEKTSQIAAAIRGVCGLAVSFDFRVAASEPAAAASEPRETARGGLRRRLQEKESHPFVQRAGELFGARAVAVEEPQRDTD